MPPMLRSVHEASTSGPLACWNATGRSIDLRGCLRFSDTRTSAFVRRAASLRQSLVAVRTRVRESSRSAQGPVKGWQRHFEGWQAGLLAVLIAGTSAVLGVPRAVAP